MNYANFKPTLRARGVPVQQDGRAAKECYRSAEDTDFKSPSGAARIVGGAAVNGRTASRVADTKLTYGEWDDADFKQGNG